MFNVLYTITITWPIILFSIKIRTIGLRVRGFVTSTIIIFLPLSIVVLLIVVLGFVEAGLTVFALPTIALAFVWL